MWKKVIKIERLIDSSVTRTQADEAGKLDRLGVLMQSMEKQRDL